MSTVQPVKINPSYTPEQQALIDAAIEGTNDTLNGFLSFSWSDRFVQRGNQVFAVFHEDSHYPTAHELLPFECVEDELGQTEFIPVVVDGRMIYREPDEGRSGAAYLCCNTKPDGNSTGWFVSWPFLGWLKLKELDLSNMEISERIAEDIDRGAAHITGGSPGL